MANQSFIVGDAGGTGTQWRIVKSGTIRQFETIGFNAYTHSVEDLKTSIQQTFGSQIEKGIPVFFYAAGIDTQEQVTEVENSLRDIFGEKVVATNDQIGVARSLCGKEKGNVCILGTGSNACFYDGEKVNKAGASLGYVLGDEGSGAYLGKKIIKKVFRDQLPKEIIHSFQNRFNLTAHEAIHQVYNKPRPNHFLALFAPFIYEHRNHSEIYQLLISAFNDFFDAFFLQSNHLHEPFYFSGSIAFHFADIVRQVGNDRGYIIKNIIQSPISGLVLYHQQYD